MCGRFTLATDFEVLKGWFEADFEIEFEAHYNISPSKSVICVRENVTHQRESVSLRWGLIPSWTKADNISSGLINARSESAHEKPSFRAAFKKRRCLIVADGFYEWRQQNNSKQPYYIFKPERKPFAFAGLWEHWEPKPGESGDIIESCTILTTDANKKIAKLYNRMPIIVPHDAYDVWLDRETQSVDALESILQHPDNDDLMYYPVSTKVNNPQFDDPACIEEMR